MTAFALVLIFSVGNGYSATVSISGPAEVNPLLTPQFEIDVMINDIDPLANLDFWQLGLEISPGSNATLVSASGDSDPDYVFFGDSDDFDFTLLNNFQITVGDLTSSGDGVTDVVDKLLATVLIDISGANHCEWYSIDLFDSGNTFFGDKDFNLEFAVGLAEDYQFHVAVPIPGALWLLGSGLVCLIGLRRRNQKH
jgi:hypothetical protein